LNADNGPENNGARTQWLFRLVQFSAKCNVTVKLAYYPPYHSKYNPVERVFGVLERYWNGEPLRSIPQAVEMAAGMTYKKIHPQTRLIEAVYPKGVRLKQAKMRPVEKCLQRLAGLLKWSITIDPDVARLYTTSLA
jgi:Rhodopirellula transposase DDE domain